MSSHSRIQSAGQSISTYPAVNVPELSPEGALSSSDDDYHSDDNCYPPSSAIITPARRETGKSKGGSDRRRSSHLSGSVRCEFNVTPIAELGGSAPETRHPWILAFRLILRLAIAKARVTILEYKAAGNKRQRAKEDLLVIDLKV
ncbi:uncharacterized protein FIBRA_01366 [Fibroporia radiculosa]|uniref:Uncharacterized protein n=1 Tax=Fibroporia radiculosa TaxID=599839 RepID=J4G0Y2_9APHY|nr:uncharacterized protein FIBRA_01366 [Fibroporia radiculosa]CCL99348.1 predicted protein [Fibroporia radiculosa]